MKRELSGRLARARRGAGFTLLEMMVVMTLLGLLTTLVLPSMQRWHDAVQTRSRVAAVVEALQAAAFAAPASHKRLVMQQGSFTSAAAIESASAASGSSSGPAATAAMPTASAAGEADATSTLPSDATLLRIELPAGWRAERVRDAEFLPNGLCRAGFASLRTERGSPVVVVVDGPLCAVRTSDSEPAA